MWSALVPIDREVNMRLQPQMRVVAAAAVLMVSLILAPAVACLRDTLDDRAVEWSSEIVLANLLAVNSPQPMNAGSTSQPDTVENSSGKQYQTYDFQVTESYDGPAKVGDKITVIRFIIGPDSSKSSICGQTFTDRQVGKSFLLLLRPEADISWSDRAGESDPRTPQLHALKALLVVHLESAYDLGTDGLEDAKYTITSTRQAEAQFKTDDAKLQAQTMINAADDTEESQAEHALLEMGPKILPVMQDDLSQTDGQDRARILRVIRAVSPPSILTSSHQH